MTIQDIYELTKLKKENAELHYTRIIKLHNSIPMEIKERDLLNNLKGEIEAYTDVKILIETSGVLEDD